MNHVDLPLERLAEQAVQAARSAGQLIQSTDRSSLTRLVKRAGTSAASQLVTDLDIRTEALIRERLRRSCERWDIAFVGEESSAECIEDTPERLQKPWYWCVDPLDGTLPFMEGRPGYAVSIALLQRNGDPLIGVVYDPVNATLWHAVKGRGAYQENAAIAPVTRASGALTVFADASLSQHEDYERLFGILTDYAAGAALGELKLVYGSGAVKNACQVLQTPASCYIKMPRSGEGGGSIWDFAATACIVREAGGWVSNIQGGPLDLNRRDSTFMNHEGVLFASNTEMAHGLIERFTNLSA